MYKLITRLQLVTVIVFVLFIESIYSENSAAVNQSQLLVQPSKYVKMIHYDLTFSEDSLIFEGKFIILGKNIFGHFDIAAYNDSGRVMLQTKSSDRAYRKEQGSKVKSIKMNIGKCIDCRKVEVFFHEMRLDPDIGGCVSKQYKKS